MSRLEHIRAALDETARGLEAAERQISRITDRQREYYRNMDGDSAREFAVAEPPSAETSALVRASVMSV